MVTVLCWEARLHKSVITPCSPTTPASANLCDEEILHSHGTNLLIYINLLVRTTTVDAGPVHHASTHMLFSTHFPFQAQTHDKLVTSTSSPCRPWPHFHFCLAFLLTVAGVLLCPTGTTPSIGSCTHCAFLAHVLHSRCRQMAKSYSLARLVSLGSILHFCLIFLSAVVSHYAYRHNPILS